MQEDFIVVDLRRRRRIAVWAFVVPIALFALVAITYIAVSLGDQGCSGG